MSTASQDPRRSAREVAGADPRRWQALAVLAAMQLMLVLDITVVTVAPPKIQHDLHFSHAGLAWVVDGFVLMAGGFPTTGLTRQGLYQTTRICSCGAPTSNVGSAPGRSQA
jgi:hypothetical protein